MPPSPISSHGPQDDDDDDDDDNRGGVTDEGDSFVAPSRDAPLKKFGKEGTKKALVQENSYTHTLAHTQYHTYSHTHTYTRDCFNKSCFLF